MIKDRYYVKIVPQKGETVHRFAIRRRHIVAILGALAVLIVGSFVFAGIYTLHAHAQMASLRNKTVKQQESLKQIDRQTDELRKQLQHVQTQNQEIRQLIGVPAHPAAKTSWIRGGTLSSEETRIRTLRMVSNATVSESDSIRTLAMRVLNIRHMHDLAQAEMIASIPSIDPVDGGPIVGCFCYRTYPDVEFHEGVDLGANYGESVRASAAGTIVANSWDGSYGIKIDINHGNGYHTWYAHLSRVDVRIGQHVYKGEIIGAVGATGFATGPHLHYQIMHNGTPVDPTPFLTGVPANVLASLP